MRVIVTPQQAAVVPGQVQPIAITITNTSTVIGGYAVRLLGADPGWVTLEADQVSLFPEETRTLIANITAPLGIPSGSRRIAVQVRELTPPEASSITEIDLTVPAAKSVHVRAEPLAVTAGKRATFSLVVENTGNTMIAAHLAGEDAENQVDFVFEPERVALSPGEHAVVDMRAKARRHLTGSPTVRMLGVYLDDEPADGFFAGPPPENAPARSDTAALANATFIQRAVLSRGPLSLLGLLAAVTVFAIVIVFALSRLVGQSTADRDLALQVAAARNASAASGTSGVAGTVRLLTSGKPVAGVAVGVFSAADTSAPIATTATDDKGAYSVGNLAAGKYKISFRGAGFVQLWYPGATSDADAKTVTLAASQQQANLDVSLGGVPATISGTVVGDDVSASTLYLETIPGGTQGTGTAASTTTGLPATTPGTTTPPDNGNAVVKTVPIGSDGTFSLVDVPSPSIYQLVVTKTGYATSTQSIDIGAGENRTGVQLSLAKGDGIISGTVSSPTGVLSGATITATVGQSTASTVSLTGAKPGTFTLRGLPTPATFTVTATKRGFATQTLSLTLASGQKLTGVSITLGASSGKLTGAVTQVPQNVGAGGVSVTVTDGLLTVQSVTESKDDIGHWEVAGLPVPGTYTVTFTRRDLASQTVSVSLDSSGNLTPGSQGARITSTGIAVSMQSSTATVLGKIKQVGGRTVCDSANGLGEANVTLNSGTSSYTVVSASVPSGSCGQYRIDQLPPGTYTITVTAGSGTSPASAVITLNAGDERTHSVKLSRPASMTGAVQRKVGSLEKRQCGWTVFLYQLDDYPTGVPQTTKTTDGCADASDAHDPSAAGVFTFNDIAAGKYIVSAGPTSDPANASTTKQVTVQPSQQLAGVTIEVPEQ